MNQGKKSQSLKGKLYVAFQNAKGCYAPVKGKVSYGMERIMGLKKIVNLYLLQI